MYISFQSINQSSSDSNNRQINNMHILAFNGIFNSTLFFPGFAVKKITFMQIVFTVTIYWTESLPLFSSKASCRLNVLTPLLVLTHVVVEHAQTNAGAAVGAKLSMVSMGQSRVRKIEIHTMIFKRRKSKHFLTQL